MTSLPGRNQHPRVTGKKTKDREGKVAQPHQYSISAPTQEPSWIFPVLVTTASVSLTLKMTF